MGYVLTSHDGTDEQGVRAEVRVEIGEGVISGIDKRQRSAQVSFVVEGLKNPVKAWVKIDSPAFEVAEFAHQSGHPVSYRIEQHRKAGENRSVPIESLRVDMATAFKSTTRIFALINEVESGEGVTNPAEDQGGNKTYKATTDDITPVGNSGSLNTSVSSETILASLVALSALSPEPNVLTAAVGAAIALGADPVEVFKVAGGKDRSEGEERPEYVKESYSSEAPSWKIWNTDGRQNLGHMRFSAGVGAESFVREQLVAKKLKDEALEEGVSYFAKLILSIADGVQTKAYGQGGKPDRAAQSHARIRGVIYDTIKNYIPLPFPITGKADANVVVHQWIVDIGSTAYTRFIIGLEASATRKSFSDPLPELLYGKQEVPEKPAPTTTAKAAKKAATVTLPVVKEEVVTPVSEEKTVSLDELAVFAPVDIKSLPLEKQKPLATKETLAELNRYVKESGLATADYGLIGNLLKYTFGPEHKLAKGIPDPILDDFTNEYIAAGEENFLAVLRAVPKQD